MGFAPKHVKRRRHHRNMVVRAKVALAGIRIVQSRAVRKRNTAPHRNPTADYRIWCVELPDGWVDFSMSLGAAANVAARAYDI